MNRLFRQLPYLFFLFVLGCAPRPSHVPVEEAVPPPRPVPHLALDRDRDLGEEIPTQSKAFVDALAVLPGGDVCVASALQGQLYRYSPEGELVEKILPARPRWKPKALAVSPQGTLYVGSSARVFLYRPGQRQWDTDFPSDGLGVRHVGALACDATGDLWVLDATAKAIRHFSARGEAIPGWNPTLKLNFPGGLAVTPEGNILCTDDKTIYCLDRRGKLIRQWRQPNRLTKRHAGIQLLTDSEGFVFATHPDLHTVEIYTPEGEHLFRWIHSVYHDRGIRSPTALALDPQGSFYVSHRGNHLTRFNLHYAPPDLPPAERGVTAKGPNIVLITIDTTRLDHLGFAGHPYPTSPVLDALAGQGVWFPEAISPAADTTACHCTILTSLQPFSHEARNVGFYLRPEVVTVAEILQEAGYHTAAFTSGYTLVPEITWIDQGFRVYDAYNAIHDGRTHHGKGTRRAGDTNEQAFRWLQGKKGEKIFLWVHYFDPHSEYDPLPEYRGRFTYDPSIATNNETINLGWIEEKVGNLIARYDEEILYVDTQVGHLLEQLRRLGFMDDLFLAVMADHGEVLYEQKAFAFNHGHSLLEPEFHIPLILRDYTGRTIRNQSRQSEWKAELIDVAPTLIEVAGLPQPDYFQGVSLAKVLREKVPPRPFTFSQMLKHKTGDVLGAFCVRKDDWKIQCYPRDKRGRILDPNAEDPTENTLLNLSPEDMAKRLEIPLKSFPAEVATAADRMLLYWMCPGWERVLDLHQVETEQVHRQIAALYGEAIGWNPDSLIIEQPVEEAPLDEERMQHLRALGYIVE